MKTMKIQCAIPTAGTVTMKFAHSLIRLYSDFILNQIDPEIHATMRLDVCESSNWITNREKLVARAIADDFTHVFFLDDDMVFSPEVLKMLVKRDKDIVVTNYLLKTEPVHEAKFCAVGMDWETKVPTKEESTGLEKVAFAGFGCSLISTEVFKKVPQPWFQPYFVPDKNEYSTEDVAFFHRCEEQGIDVWLDHDTSKLLSHTGRKDWNWRECVYQLEGAENAEAQAALR